MMPLEDPRLGARTNASFFASFPHRCATDCRARRILSTAAVAATALLWRFPVPFLYAVLFGTILVSFVSAHVVVLRGRLLRRDSVLRGPIVAFLPSFAAQCSAPAGYTRRRLCAATPSRKFQDRRTVTGPFCS
jgi:hypothetical protein